MFTTSRNFNDARFGFLKYVVLFYSKRPNYRFSRFIHVRHVSEDGRLPQRWVKKLVIQKKRAGWRKRRNEVGYGGGLTTLMKLKEM